MRSILSIVGLGLIISMSLSVQASQENSQLNLLNAVIITHSPEQIVRIPITMFQQEIARRGKTPPPWISSTKNISVPSIVVDLLETFPDKMSLPENAREILTKPEAYAIWSDVSPANACPKVYVVGSDFRGILFGVGRLIRVLELKQSSFSIPHSTKIFTAPQYPIRGHQLGYRETANSYDAWDTANYEQYIRDLILFGTNSIELIPTLEPGKYEGKLMKRDMWEMTCLLSELIGKTYGLDVWLWLPLDEDVTNPKEAQLALEQRRVLFQSCPAIAHVMVPGGDPGHTPPHILMPWLEKLAEVLHETHPNAGLWVSNQGFDHNQNEWFFNYLQQQKPTWLKGVVYGPWTKVSLEEQRTRMPDQYLLRCYPDITHTLRCQFPIPEWDRAFALTWSREPICPRPHDMIIIFNHLATHSNGFVSYSDGIHDDFNKIAFSMLGWDPSITAEEITREYADAFFGDDLKEKVAHALFGLESNWKGPITTNTNIEKTLKQWESIASRAGTDFQNNWRLQMYVYRANYDSFLQHKDAFDRQMETEILASVKNAISSGGDQVAKVGLEAIKKATNQPLPAEIQAQMSRITELALMLFKSIGYQLSVRPPFYALNPERSGSLDFLNYPLNNTLWLEKQFQTILAMQNPSDQINRINEILNWENPSEDCLYDDLGDLTKQPHLIRQTTWKEDPGFIHGPQEEYSRSLDNATLQFITDRLSWLNQAQTLYGTPLKMHYENLSPTATYKLRVTYAGRFKASMELWADGEYKIHDALPQPDPVWPIEFDIPKEATQDGVLELEWRLVSGRGCQVAEVWLIPN